MKTFIWILFGSLLLLWSGGLWATAELTRWLFDAVASGQAVDWAAIASSWRLPAWLTWWIDPAALEAVFGAVVAGLEALRGTLPFAESAGGWLVAGLWVVWGGGALLLLLMAFGAHLVVSRRLIPRAAAGA